MSAGVVEGRGRNIGPGVWGFFALAPFVIFVVSAETQAQEASEPIVSSADQLPRLYVLPAGTQVHLRLLESVASHTHQRGTRFRLEVAEVIAIDDQIVVPAGSPAIGEVIHAAKSGMSGKGGELILATRFLLAGEREVRLRSFTAGNGIDRLALATGLGVTIGIPALFVVGKNLVLPIGTDVYAKVAADTSLPSVVGTWEAGIPQPSIAESSTENDNENDSE
jgi:hypothetical protein